MSFHLPGQPAGEDGIEVITQQRQQPSYFESPIGFLTPPQAWDILPHCYILHNP